MKIKNKSKRRKQYQPLNCERILQSLQEENQQVKKQAEHAKEPQREFVPAYGINPSVRRKTELQEQQDMRYAYSREQRILHDRDCEWVAAIPAEAFEMTREIIPCMPRCKQCRRKAIIRSGMTGDWKRINAYVRFFDRAGLSDKQLSPLFRWKHAQIRLIAADEMQVWVNGDAWVIKLFDNVCELWHNDYYMSDQGERVLKRSFHRQHPYKIKVAEALGKIYAYSGEKHAEQIKETGLGRGKINA